MLEGAYQRRTVYFYSQNGLKWVDLPAVALHQAETATHLRSMLTGTRLGVGAEGFGLRVGVGMVRNEQRRVREGEEARGQGVGQRDACVRHRNADSIGKAAASSLACRAWGAAAALQEARVITCFAVRSATASDLAQRDLTALWLAALSPPLQRPAERWGALHRGALQDAATMRAPDLTVMRAPPSHRRSSELLRYTTTRKTLRSGLQPCP